MVGDIFVVEGGHTLIKVSSTEAEFPEAPNVGKIKHELETKTYTEIEFETLPRTEINKTFEV